MHQGRIPLAATTPGRYSLIVFGGVWLVTATAGWLVTGGTSPFWIAAAFTLASLCGFGASGRYAAWRAAQAPPPVHDRGQCGACGARDVTHSEEWVSRRVQLAAPSGEVHDRLMSQMCRVRRCSQCAQILSSEEIGSAQAP
jgi:hypothetical protein